jgi:hypothetical protein
MTRPVTTWLGDPDLKAKTLAAYDAHIKQDALIRGTYAKQNGVFKGCHIGCLVHDLTGADAQSIKDMGGNQRRDIIAEKIGQPNWLTSLAEYFFERLEPPKNQQVSRAILDATPVGVDLTPVYHRFMIWLLTDEQHGSRQYADDAGQKATDAIVALHERAASSDTPKNEEWDAARVAAKAAARAGWAGCAAARGAQSDALIRLLSEAAAWAAARDAQADALIRLLSEAAA